VIACKGVHDMNEASTVKKVLIGTFVLADIVLIVGTLYVVLTKGMF
jgi:hypothetical protein